ncbi:MAG: hypothetical protein D8H92_04180 [Campylobacter sp.]|nr:MAG: hypothetical protein D8H92_04180 [Campylobacter sp.]
MLAKFQLPKFHLSKILPAAADTERIVAANMVRWRRVLNLIPLAHRAERRILKFSLASANISRQRQNLKRAVLNFKISSAPQSRFLSIMSEKF